MSVELTKQQIAAFKTQLLELQKTLLKDITNSKNKLNYTEKDPESYSVAADIMAVVEKQHQTLMTIEHALYKIEAGEYGECEETGDPIPLKRLEILPYTTCTVEGEKIRKSYL